MSTIRLSNLIRDKITDQAVIHRFGKEATALLKDFAALAEDIYNDVLSKKERETIQSLPEKWFSTTSNIRVQFGASYTTIYFNGGSIKKIDTSLETKHKIVPYYMLHGCIKVYAATHELAERYHDLSDKKKDLENRISEARQIIRPVLNGSSTVDTLVKKWPEVHPILKKVNLDVTSNLPSTTIEQINTIFNLP